MSNEQLKLNSFPKSHIKPYDGMPVTAELWSEAHGEHRQAMLAHDLVFHGAGVVCGLEVTANDPPDQYVFITPGVAVDPAGNVIVVAEPVAYDFGSAAEGDLYLMVGHGEREVERAGSDVHVVQDEFVIAARSSMPKRPAVELGRVRLSKRGAAIQNAPNPFQPQADEIDLRYRVSLALPAKKIVRVGIVQAGEPAAEVLSGWNALARACRRNTDNQLVIEPYASVGAAVSAGAGLIYLAARGSFAAEPGLVRDLAAHVESGNGLVLDACDGAAVAGLQDLAKKVDGSLREVAEGHPLLAEPFLFVEAPGPHPLLAGKKTVFAQDGLSLAWAGKTPGSAGRDTIRTAHEWGMNIVSYCLNERV